MADEACAGIGFQASPPFLPVRGFRAPRPSGVPRNRRKQTASHPKQPVPHGVAIRGVRAAEDPNGAGWLHAPHDESSSSAATTAEPSCCAVAHKPFAEKQTGDLRLLLVPYPFRVSASAFVAGKRIRTSSSARFTIRHEWLRRIGPRPRVVDELTAFVRRLMQEARRNVGPVNGIVFPEGCLDEQSAEIAARLAGTPQLEFFIAGVNSPPKRAHLAPRRNRAYASLYSGGTRSSGGSRSTTDGASMAGRSTVTVSGRLAPSRMALVGRYRHLRP